MEAACRDAGGASHRAPVRDRRAEARVRQGAASGAPHGASAATKPDDANRRWLAREASGGERGRRSDAPTTDERIESDKFGGDKGSPSLSLRVVSRTARDTDKRRLCKPRKAIQARRFRQDSRRSQT